MSTAIRRTSPSDRARVRELFFSGAFRGQKPLKGDRLPIGRGYDAPAPWSLKKKVAVWGTGIAIVAAIIWLMISGLASRGWKRTKSVITRTCPKASGAQPASVDAQNSETILVQLGPAAAKRREGILTMQRMVDARS